MKKPGHVRFSLWSAFAAVVASTTISIASAYAAGPGYVALGDSIDFGIGVADPATDGYVAKLHQHFGTATELHNVAIPGATARDIRQQELSSALAAIAGHNPVVVSWGGGGNDLLNFIASPEAATCARGNPSCLARLNALLNEVEQTIDLTLGALRASAGPSARIVVRTQYNPLFRSFCAAPNPSLAGLAHVVLEGDAPPFLSSGLNDRIRALALKHGAGVADLYVLFAFNSEAFISDDCVHPTDAGHTAIFEAFRVLF